MAGSESSKGSSRWLKLLLWGLVIVGGFLYLRSINDKVLEDRPDVGIAEKADTAPATVDASATAPAEPAEAPEGSTQPQSISFQEEQPAPAVEGSVNAQPDIPGIPSISSAEPAEAAGTQPPPQTEPTEPAVETIPTMQWTAPDEGTQEAPTPAPVILPAPAVTEPGPATPHAEAESARTPSSAEPTPVAASVPEAPRIRDQGAPVEVGPIPEPENTQAPPSPQMTARGSSHGGAPEPTSTALKEEAFPKGLTSEGGPETHTPRTTPTAAPPAPVTPAQPPTESHSAKPTTPLSGPTASPDLPTGHHAERRARIMAEYQARQRMRREQIRQYREYTRGSRMPATGPYGAYPGYSPEDYRPWQ